MGITLVSIAIIMGVALLFIITFCLLKLGKNNKTTESSCIADGQQNMNMKKVAITVLALQLIILLLYFTTLFALINPPNFILFPIWFAIGAAGIVIAIMLLVKRKHFPLAIGLLVLGLVIIFIGGLMGLLWTMSPH